MGLFKVELAEGPTRVMNILMEAGPLPWHVLRDDFGVVSADMNLLNEIGFLTKVRVGWELSHEGRRVLVPVDGESREDRHA